MMVPKKWNSADGVEDVEHHGAGFMQMSDKGNIFDETHSF